MEVGGIGLEPGSDLDLDLDLMAGIWIRWIWIG